MADWAASAATLTLAIEIDPTRLDLCQGPTSLKQTNDDNNQGHHQQNVD